VHTFVPPTLFSNRISTFAPSTLFSTWIPTFCTAQNSTIAYVYIALQKLSQLPAFEKSTECSINYVILRREFHNVWEFSRNNRGDSQIIARSVFPKRCTVIFLVHSKSKGRSLAVSIVSRNLETCWKMFLLSLSDSSIQPRTGHKRSSAVFKTKEPLSSFERMLIWFNPPPPLSPPSCFFAISFFLTVFVFLIVFVFVIVPYFPASRWKELASMLIC